MSGHFGKGQAGGVYDWKADTIIYITSILRRNPMVFLHCFCHELMHSTAHMTRLNRYDFEPLDAKLFFQNGFPKARRHEEAIAEAATLKLLLTTGLMTAESLAFSDNYRPVYESGIDFHSVELRAEEAVSYVLNN